MRLTTKVRVSNGSGGSVSGDPQIMLGAVFQPLTHSLRTLSSVACDLVRLLVLVSRSGRALAAENLFLRKQLALFQERNLKASPVNNSTQLVM